MSEQIHVVLTEDGSPTAYFDDFESEKMHHSGGAFGESVYIYGPAIQWAFARDITTPKILSVGTGLAYNEMIAAAMALTFDADLRLQSYEKNAALNASLISWLLGKNEKNFVEKSVYDVILQKTSELYEISMERVKEYLHTKYQNGEWKIDGELPQEFQQKYNVILYDLFSSKAMETFWSEDYLKSFLNQASAEQCALATYACTGNLKRALKATGFEFFQRTGFLWKRHSSFARKSACL